MKKNKSFGAVFTILFAFMCVLTAQSKSYDAKQNHQTESVYQTDTGPVISWKIHEPATLKEIVYHPNDNIAEHVPTMYITG